MKESLSGDSEDSLLVIREGLKSSDDVRSNTARHQT